VQDNFERRKKEKELWHLQNKEKNDIDLEHAATKTTEF